VVGTLGEIEQQGATVTVRLKSDILFPEAVFLLTVDRDLRKDVRPRLAQLALLLQILFRDARFQFIGHTDTVDTDEYNQWLSEQRALEVMHFFYLARLQVMSSDDALRAEYEEKILLSEQLLGNKFPEWKPKSQPGGLGDRKAEKLRQQRQELLSQLSTVVQGRGETELRVSPELNDEDRQRNRRVEIKIELPPQSSFEYCNQSPQP
jgi:outer membrane protein OmpA-like peptidoglycan-associated protein